MNRRPKALKLSGRGKGKEVISMTLKEWLEEARQLRAQLRKTSDSVEILRQLREKRASR